jgi:hypothetical protein
MNAGGLINSELSKALVEPRALIGTVEEMLAEQQRAVIGR